LIERHNALVKLDVKVRKMEQQLNQGAPEKKL